MDDLYLKIQQLNSIFWTLTVQMLGLDPTLPETNSAVRISWPKDGAPAWKIDDDVCFIKVVPQDDEYNRIRELEYTNIEGDDLNVNQAMSYTRVLRLMWAFYGPNSEDNAQTLRDQLFYQDIHDALVPYNIYMITDIVEPIRSPEMYETRWWERVDIHVEFNELITRYKVVPCINNVNIYTTAQAFQGVKTPMKVIPATPIPSGNYTESDIIVKSD